MVDASSDAGRAFVASAQVLGTPEAFGRLIQGRNTGAFIDEATILVTTRNPGNRSKYQVRILPKICSGGRDIFEQNLEMLERTTLVSAEIRKRAGEIFSALESSLNENEDHHFGFWGGSGLTDEDRYLTQDDMKARELHLTYSVSGCGPVVADHFSRLPREARISPVRVSVEVIKRGYGELQINDYWQLGYIWRGDADKAFGELAAVAEKGLISAEIEKLCSEQLDRLAEETKRLGSMTLVPEARPV